MVSAVFFAMQPGIALIAVRQADCIHLLEAGRIVESGTHDELVARKGGYAALWRLQTGAGGVIHQMGC